MKEFLNTMRWIYIGFMLEATAVCYFIAVEEENKKKTKYNDPEWISEKMYGEHEYA